MNLFGFKKIFNDVIPLGNSLISGVVLKELSLGSSNERLNAILKDEATPSGIVEEQESKKRYVTRGTTSECTIAKALARVNEIVMPLFKAWRLMGGPPTAVTV
jgi:hypothetical protein